VFTRRRFLSLATAGAAATGLWTWQIEPHWLEVVERQLPLDQLPKAWRGARLVHLSDLHVGPQVADDYLIETFRRVRALEPDLVVYTGDFVSCDADIHPHLERLLPEFPRGRRGTFASLGNHDYGPAWGHPEIAARVATQLSGAGIRVLTNQLEVVEGIQIVGLGDLWAGRFAPADAFARLDPSRGAIALSHNPDTVDRGDWSRFRGFILAGHTHGGQCKPPFLEPPLLPVRNRRYTAGEFDVGPGRRLYISRGVGHLTQVRFNVRPEATVFELTAG
jgi:predicted MPP superfamily phosphohydrolase